MNDRDEFWVFDFDLGGFSPSTERRGDVGDWGGDGSGAGDAGGEAGAAGQESEGGGGDEDADRSGISRRGDRRAPAWSQLLRIRTMLRLSLPRSAPPSQSSHVRLLSILLHIEFLCSVLLLAFKPGSVPNRNNAGKFSHDYAVSEDGVEMTFATNYLGRRN